MNFNKLSNLLPVELKIQAGVGVAVIGSMPSVGLYFGIYSGCKKQLTKWDPDENHRIAYVALSAAIGNTIASASRVPYEVVKQKFQTQAYSNLREAFADMSLKTLFPTGGIASQMIRDIPYAVGKFDTIDQFFVVKFFVIFPRLIFLIVFILYSYTHGI